MSVQPAVSSAPTIHEADLASGASGGVIRGAEVTLAAAVVLRQQHKNIVVCGEDRKANRALAQQIETAIGPYLRHEPHKRAGPRVLPHFQQADLDHDGHSFYETPQRRALRRQP